MKQSYIIGILFLLLHCSGCACGSSDIYIALDGCDTNNGSISSPFKTVQRAMDEISMLQKKGNSKEIHVYLRGGKYYLTTPLVFDESCSGKASVCVEAYQNEKVEVYGGVSLTDWEAHGENIFRVKLPESLLKKGLYVLTDNGKPMVMARYPNYGLGYGEGLQRIDNTTIQVPDVWKNYDFTCAQIVGWIGSNWFSEQRKVISFDPQLNRLKVDPGSGNFGGLNNRVYIQGVPELLDKEGEWCINNKDGYLYYYPVCGEAPISERTIVLPVLDRILDIQGSQDNPVRNITFRNLTLCGSNFCDSWRIFEDGYDGSMPEHLQEGMVYMENVENIALEDCELLSAGHSAVYINNRSQNCGVKGCHIFGAGFCGIYANSYFPGKGGFEKIEDSYVNKGHCFTNNYIHDCGKYIGGGCGIQLYQSGDNIITHNLIHEMPRYGISYKGVINRVLLDHYTDKVINYENHYDYIHTRNNYIAYNEIFNVCRSSFDFGAIESWGASKGNVWDCNAIHDIDQTVEWDGWAHGLFPDDASDYLTVKNNIVYELKGGKATGAIMVKSYNQIVENNIFADNMIGRAMTMAPYAEPAAENCVRNNIVYHSGEMLYDTDMNSFGTDFPGFYENDFNKQYVKGKPVFTEVDKNVIYPAYDQLDSLKKKGWDTYSLIADPLFDKRNLQEDVTYLDYRLKANSPVYNVGFQPIEYNKIGLLPSFSFHVDRKRNAYEWIEAESYNRMRDLRSIAATGIYHMEPGAWAKYDSIDFSQGTFDQCCIHLLESAGEKKECLFEMRVDALDGEVIATVSGDKEVVPVKPMKGVHNLYLVFRQSVALDAFRFMASSSN
ncbi:hypothetical protein [uncultured Parabacteroides sp.]|uniref:hypothetical protein n=1 Tax=uncultured Parabacteroides sp. TaxID=512312 RepID=UPI002585F3C9|nr:hypothetical protein [uncultured Parabacteroides sp.]